MIRMNMYVQIDALLLHELADMPRQQQQSKQVTSQKQRIINTTQHKTRHDTTTTRGVEK